MEDNLFFQMEDEPSFVLENLGSRFLEYNLNVMQIDETWKMPSIVLKI